MVHEMHAIESFKCQIGELLGSLESTECSTSGTFAFVP
jgi:hypothetical protein